MPAPRATIVDVARQAEIPMATIPAVLNHTKRASKDGGSRVQQAVGRLNYWPSHLARGRRRKRTATVGLLLAGIATSPVNQLLKGLVDALAEQDDAALLATRKAARYRMARRSGGYCRDRLTG